MRVRNRICLIVAAVACAQVHVSAGRCADPPKLDQETQAAVKKVEQLVAGCRSSICQVDDVVSAYLTALAAVDHYRSCARLPDADKGTNCSSDATTLVETFDQRMRTVLQGPPSPEVGADIAEQRAMMRVRLYEAIAERLDDSCRAARTAADASAASLEAEQKKETAGGGSSETVDRAKKDLDGKQDAVKSTCHAAVTAWKDSEQAWREFNNTYRWAGGIAGQVGFYGSAASSAWMASLNVPLRVDNHYWTPSLIYMERSDGKFAGGGVEYFKTAGTTGPGVGINLLFGSPNGSLQPFLFPHFSLGVMDQIKASGRRGLLTSVRIDVAPWIPLRGGEPVAFFFGVRLGLGVTL